MPERTIITGGTLVTPRKIVEDGTLVIEEGRIAEVRRGRISRSPARAIDATGKLVVPGFVDLHVQGCSGHDVWEADAAAFRAMAVAIS